MKKITLFFLIIISFTIISFSQEEKIVLEKKIYTFNLSDQNLYKNPIDIYVASNVMTYLQFNNIPLQYVEAVVSGLEKINVTEGSASEKTVITQYSAMRIPTADKKSTSVVIIPGSSDKITPQYMHVNINVSNQIKTLVFHLIPNIPDKLVLNVTFNNDISISSPSATTVNYSVNQCLSYLLLSNINSLSKEESDDNITLKIKYLVKTADKAYLSLEIISKKDSFMIPDNLADLVINNQKIDLTKTVLFCNKFIVDPSASSKCIIEIPGADSKYLIQSLSIKFGNLVLKW